MGSHVAFVLGGGGPLGAHEVGMLQALFEAGIEPETIVGTSIGAINGAVIAAEPTLAAVDRLREIWTTLGRAEVFGGTIASRIKTLARSRTHLFDNQNLRRILTDALPVERFDELAVTFECVAASIERANARYFDSGPLIDALLASSAVPGLLPPVEIDGEHYLDGGLVASIPLDRAIARGADLIFVLQVGRIEQPLEAPTKPWEVALVAFEISRRHRFSEALATVPDHVAVHVLPTGDPKQFNDFAQYREVDDVAGRIEQSYAASAAYLTVHGLAP